MSDRIEYRTGKVPDPELLVALYQSIDWPQATTPEELHLAVQRSTWVATAWFGARLVGLARVLSDGVFDVYLQDLVVHRDFQHQGVGKELLDLYDELYGDFQTQVIVSDAAWAKNKLGKRGFQVEPAALSRTRTHPTGTAT